MPHYYLILAFTAYLLGSASSAILLCKVWYGTDIRELGSKNPGANNVQRIYGWKAGLAVFLIDFLKGIGAVSLIYLTELNQGSEMFVVYQIILGLSAVVGHIFPIFFGFKGGKGVSIITGVLAAIHPWAMVLCLGIFMIMMLFTRYISLSVLVSITFYPILINSMFALWLIPEETLTLKIFSIIIAVILWLTHLSNLKRLIKGEEVKFSFKKPEPIFYKNSR